MAQLLDFVAIGGVSVPKHLRGNPGACIAVVQWRLSPCAVANKSYSVNDRLGYEAQGTLDLSVTLAHKCFYTRNVGGIETLSKRRVSPVRSP